MTHQASPSPFDDYDYDYNSQNTNGSLNIFGGDDAFGMMDGNGAMKQGSGDSGMSMGSTGSLGAGGAGGIGADGNGGMGMDVSRRDSGDEFVPAMVALAAKDKLQEQSNVSTGSAASGMGMGMGMGGGGYAYHDQTYGHSPGSGQAQMMDPGTGMYAQMDQGWDLSPGFVQAQHQQQQQQQQYQYQHQSLQMQHQQQQRSTGAHELFGGAAPHNAAAPPQTSASATFGLAAHTPYSAGHTPEPSVWGMPHTPDPEVKMEMDLDPWSGTGPGMDPKEFEELVERLSNQGSRAPTPNPMNDYPTPVSFPTSHTDGSLQSSHNESPYPTHIPSPSFSPLPRPGSATSNHSGVMSNTSPFSKPHSPPALVMPNNNAPSPAPALPPIVTQPAAPAHGSGGQGHALTGQIGGMGGLLPPINPQLEHLSGMMGISPIAPNADGPQIFVQPSTPISGLKDGRGHFDAVLRKVGLQAQLQGQGSGSGQSSQSHSGGSDHSRSRSPSISGASSTGNSPGHYNVPPPNAGSGSVQNAQHTSQTHLQNDIDWDSLSTLAAGNSARPRAKSDSHMPFAEADRQAMFNYLAQTQMAGVAPDQAVMGSMEPAQRRDVEGWLSSMSMNSPGMGYSQLRQQQQQQVEMPTTMNPNQLPGNDDAPSPGMASAAATIATSAPPTARPGYTSAADELRAKHLQQQRQLELIQAQQRHKLSLDTSLASQNALSNNGILKYEPGQFSPTTLAVYQQQGVFPVGSSVAPLAGVPGGMGLFTAPTGGLDQAYNQMGRFNPAHISTTASAPYYQTHFATSASGSGFPSAGLSSMGGQFPHTAAPGGGFLAPTEGSNGGMPRRRSFAEGSGAHHATGAGTPGYGAALQRPSPLYAGTPGGPATLSPFGTLDPGRLRGVGAQSLQGHRRSAKSEDFGRSGWGVGQGGSTADFLNSITGNDGSLAPPLRGRTNSHSRHSSASSVRSASPALSISSQGSSMSMSHPDYRGAGRHRMDMPEGQSVPMPMGHPSHSRSGSNASQQGAARLAKMKVTSMATEVAATSRRTNDGVFHCPVPGCGSTFTRHFNLKGHMRSHNDERPFKCLFDGCPKAEIGFARQHDCKRHMLLHVGLRPFECDACGKKFARLDALTRHHKSEQGQECAITHPLPTNPDGSAMSESQYKAHKAHEAQMQGLLHPDQGGDSDPAGESGKKGKGRRKSAAGGRGKHLSASNSASGLSGDEDIGGGMSGMEDYDRA